MHSACCWSPTLTSARTRLPRVISCEETCVWENGASASSPVSAWAHRHTAVFLRQSGGAGWCWHSQTLLSTKKQLGTSVQAESTLEVPSYPFLFKAHCFRKNKKEEEQWGKGGLRSSACLSDSRLGLWALRCSSESLASSDLTTLTTLNGTDRPIERDRACLSPTTVDILSNAQRIWFFFFLKQRNRVLVIWFLANHSLSPGLYQWGRIISRLLAEPVVPCSCMVHTICMSERRSC